MQLSDFPGKKAWFIKTVTWLNNSKSILYKMEPPYLVYNVNLKHIIVSTKRYAPAYSPDTHIYAATSEGKIYFGDMLPGSIMGTESHEIVLAGIGYKIGNHDEMPEG